jgi:hypothetical protein
VLQFIVQVSSSVFLCRLQPTSDDIEMYKSYKGRPESLQTADQFLMELGKIPNLNLRLDALVAIMELPNQFDDVEPVIIIRGYLIK